MVLVCDKLSDIDFEQLMLVYEEGNRENGRMRYPNESEGMQLRLAEQDFEDYLRRDFFSVKNARYYIWEENGDYISALRMEPYLDGMLLCALETKVCYRRKGFAKSLVDAVLAATDLPVYSHISKRNKASIATHLACGFRKLLEGAIYLDGSVNAFADTYIFTK